MICADLPVLDHTPFLVLVLLAIILGLVVAYLGVSEPTLWGLEISRTSNLDIRGRTRRGHYRLRFRLFVTTRSLYREARCHSSEGPTNAAANVGALRLR